MDEKGSAHVGLLTAEFFIPGPNSLKAKRAVLNSLRDRIRNEFNVAAAEIGYRDKWQRSCWAFCVVGPDKGYIEGQIEKLISFLRSGRSADLVDYRAEFL